VFALYAESAVIYPPNTPSITGKDNVHKFALDFAAISGLALNFQPIEVQVSRAGDLGYTVNIVDLKMNDPQGNPISERVRDVHFWEKEANGQWRVVIDIWNSEQPLASPAESEPSK
jgi:ketosteroid isomerase-like protein